MKYIKTDWHIPYYNMAFEEYALNDEKFKEGCFFFYIHKPSIIIGNHQNTYSEINYDYVKDNNIIVARRLSGGGAVYHDEGNLNFSFILPRGENDFIDFEKYTSPVISALKKAGVNCELSGRNDITVDGRKFSGNAQYRTKNMILHHGTIMFNVDIHKMVSALSPDSEKFIGKAVESVRNRVANLKDYLPDDFSVYALEKLLIDEFMLNAETEEYILDEDDISAVDRKVKEKFSLDEYNYGSKIPFEAIKKRKFPAGLIQAEFNVKNNIITDIKITGDYFANEDISAVEKHLKNCVYSEDEIKKSLASLNQGAGFDNIISNFTAGEFIELLFS